MANETKTEVKTEPKAETPKEVPVKMAGELIQHLHDTGTGRGRLEMLREYVRVNPKASAEDAYKHMTTWMKENDIYAGTLRKACHFVYGSDHEPELLVMQEPEDEIKRLRSENATLRGQIDEANAKNSMLLKRLEIAESRFLDASRAASLRNYDAGVSHRVFDDPTPDTRGKKILDFEPVGK